ncbi:MAG: hypothetical protein K1X78_02870 [Verrucomicrobiaceae bacterium]|nr:hypothetical protein [Verrucomicrobiaceae bacterium]
MKRPLALFTTLLLPALTASNARDAFQTPGNGENLGVWRITNEPEMRHWANYHNTRCFSPDGRYLCYARDAENKLHAEVFLYDAHKDQTRRVDAGALPRWAHGHNWLFYRQLRRDERDAPTSDILWLDVDSGERRVLASLPGEIELGEPDADDQWLHGGTLTRSKDKDANVKKERSALRIRIADKSEVQPLPGVRGYQFMPNPRHPVFFTRWKGDRSDFTSSRLWYDLDGTKERIGIPMLQNAHTSWLGDGEYHLMGNGLVRGRRWNEPFPSDLHILAAVPVGDVSPCGDSGRYATGDHNIADLRSGDGWTFLHPLSQICFPAVAGDASTIYDADPKGSPDGTKVALVTNYDLKEAPFTLVTKDLADGADELQVESTARFPDSGELVIRGEIIAYQRKTAQSFAGLARKQHGTSQSPVRSGADVTSFAARLLTDEQWQRLGEKASDAMQNGVGNAGPILLRQRQTQVHVAIVRLPDAPHLRLVQDKAELIPAEEHRETFGYHLLRDGKRITTEPLRPGARHELAEPGDYQALAVEWSGLESKPSPVVKITRATTLTALADKPADFSWTSEHKLANGREIIHLHDGVIQREQHERGVLVKHEDLNAQGKAIRELTYLDGKLARRQYTNRDGVLMSRELFDADGFIAETILFDRRSAPAATPKEIDHWWFQRGMPVKQIKEGKLFTRQGDHWVNQAAGSSAKKKGKP